MSRTSWRMLSSPPVRVHLEDGRILSKSEVPDHPDTHEAMAACDICRDMPDERGEDRFTSTVDGAAAFEEQRSPRVT